MMEKQHIEDSNIVITNVEIRVKMDEGLIKILASLHRRHHSNFLELWLLLFFHIPADFRDTAVLPRCLRGCWDWDHEVVTATKTQITFYIFQSILNNKLYIMYYK